MEKIAKLKNDSEIVDALDREDIAVFQKELGESTYLRISDDITANDCIDATSHGFELFATKFEGSILGPEQVIEVSYEDLDRTLNFEPDYMDR